MLTLISRTVPVLVYKTVYETIQQNTAVRYNSRLKWSAMNLRLQQTVTHFCSSDVRRPFITQVQLCVVAAFCVHSVESVEDVWGEEEFDIYRAGEVNLIFFKEWQRNLTNT
jgi:hypothetical protein